MAGMRAWVWAAAWVGSAAFAAAPDGQEAGAASALGEAARAGVQAPFASASTGLEAASGRGGSGTGGAGLGGSSHKAASPGSFGLVGASLQASVAAASSSLTPLVIAGQLAPSPVLERRYVDGALGFEIGRPDASWDLDAQERRTEDGVAIPLTFRHASGAQVVLQVAPAVATPTELCERLAQGLGAQAGVSTDGVEPLPLSESAVGFRFAMGEEIRGRVAVVKGLQGQVYLMLATWPRADGEALEAGVETIFRSLKPLPAS